jgi:phosphatidylglycerol:prolipoprotein diacylglycerol transferase
MENRFVHQLDPAIGQIFGFAVYWYGAVYTAGFVGIFLWLWFRRGRLGWSRLEVADFTIFAAIGMLVCGRAFDIAVYELGFYREHPLQALNWWKGGLASHGVLLGAAAASVLFAGIYRKSFIELADEVVVPAAFLFAVGRLGNFVEGGVIGSQTSLPWGVVYPDLEGPRHPVALYESAKNFLIVFLLVAVLKRFPAGRGIAMAVFILAYAALRLFVDTFRDYESYWLGLGKGQFFNLVMAGIGLLLLIWFAFFAGRAAAPSHRAVAERPLGWMRTVLLAFLFVYPLGIPTSWTQVNIEQKRTHTLQSENDD